MHDEASQQIRSDFRAFALRVVNRVLVAYAFVLLFTLHTPLTEWLALPLFIPAAVRQADAIVVLEAWASETGELNEAGLRRSLAAADIYRSGAAPCIVLSGLRTVDGSHTSALLPMAALLNREGVPVDAIHVDDSSPDTHSSAIAVATVYRARGWRSILLVTDAIHMRRASLAFARQGIVTVPAPTMLAGVGGAQPSLRLSRVRTLLHEYGGMAYYWWRGWV